MHLLSHYSTIWIWIKCNKYCPRLAADDHGYSDTTQAYTVIINKWHTQCFACISNQEKVIFSLNLLHNMFLNNFVNKRKVIHTEYPCSYTYTHITIYPYCLFSQHFNTTFPLCVIQLYCSIHSFIRAYSYFFNYTPSVSLSIVNLIYSSIHYLSIVQYCLVQIYNSNHSTRQVHYDPVWIYSIIHPLVRVHYYIIQVYSNTHSLLSSIYLALI